jgi:transmembrane sensor
MNNIMKHNFTFDDAGEETVIRFLNGDMSPGEMDAFNEWVDSSPENRSLFQSTQEIWLGRAISAPDDRFNPNTGWKKVEIIIRKGTYRQKYVNACRERRLYFRVAATAAIYIFLFGLGALLSWMVFTGKFSDQSPVICEINVPPGSRSHVLLPDGSKVWLNAGSTIKYDQNFNNREKIVELSGEAHFDIKTDPRKPFIVRTSHLDVKALGTVFNVRAYPEDDEILTTLVDGKLIIEIPGKEVGVFTYALEPRQNFTYRKSGTAITAREKTTGPAQVHTGVIGEMESMPAVTPKTVVLVRTDIRPELYTSWKDDEWIIEGESLESMAKLLSRRYNTDIDIRNGELNRYRFTGTIRNETLEQVLEILRMTAPLRFEVGKGEVIWQLDKKLAAKYDGILERKD